MVRKVGKQTKQLESGIGDCQIHPMSRQGSLPSGDICVQIGLFCLVSSPSVARSRRLN
jgi:hypothetical protein